MRLFERAGDGLRRLVGPIALRVDPAFLPQLRRLAGGKFERCELRLLANRGVLLFEGQDPSAGARQDAKKSKDKGAGNEISKTVGEKANARQDRPKPRAPKR